MIMKCTVSIHNIEFVHIIFTTLLVAHLHFRSDLTVVIRFSNVLEVFPIIHSVNKLSINIYTLNIQIIVNIWR